jgi:DNA (cytosine-5)-methyltransferase 1
MMTPQLILGLADELVVDLFAGGGGASTGIEQAIGRHVDIAVNHDPEAVSLHQANHPQTRHFVSDVFEVDPVTVCGDQPVGLLWASPDCKHFSKAKGGKPRSKKIRALAWVVIKWAKAVRPRVICLENVEEFQTWGPLLADGQPCPERKGRTFQRWLAQLRNLGYQVDMRELRACDYGAPTIRKRFFLVARRDGQPIVWPDKTHGPGLKPYRTAAECIDWSIPCPSIFERERPLAEATLRRIAHGIKRYVIDAPKPFIVPVTHNQGANVHPVSEPLRTVTTAKRGELALAVPHVTKFRQSSIGSGCDEPLHTVTAGGEQARPGTGNAMGLVSATLVQTGYGERPGQAPRVPGLDKPLGTCVDGQKHGLVAAFLAKHYGGHETPGTACDAPISTVTTQDHHHLVAAQLVGVGGRTGQGQSPAYEADRPARTITAEGDTALVTAQLAKLRGTGRSNSVQDPLHTVSAQGEHHALVSSHLVGAGGPEYSGKPRPVGEPIGTLTTENHRAEVRALLLKYYGTDQDPELREPLHTVTTKDRFGLVTVKGVDYFIADIGMRMLQPRELYRAQGFPESYVIDRGADGRPLSKAAQVRMCGNSVCPPLARAIVAANYSEQRAMREAA